MAQTVRTTHTPNPFRYSPFWRPLSTDPAGARTINTQIETRRPKVQTYSQPSHGFSLPGFQFIPVRRNTSGSWVSAQADTEANVHEAFIVGIPTVDTLEIVDYGFFTLSAAHGLNVGERYLLSDTVAGGIQSVGMGVPDVRADVCVVVSSTDVMFFNHLFDVPTPDEILVSATSPSATEYQGWIDTSVSPPEFYVSDGAAWSVVGATPDEFFVGATAPSASDYHGWIDTSVAPPNFHVSDGVTWHFKS